MADTNDLNDQNSSRGDHPASLNQAAYDSIIARLVEVENAVNTQAGNKKGDGEQSDTEKELLDRVKKGERWMIFLTGLIFLTAVFQAYETWSNNGSSGKQVDRIIDAANRIDNAADSFSRSASGINSGVSDAVRKLGEQSKSTKQVAAATLKASDATIEAAKASGRPYLIPNILKQKLIGQCFSTPRMHDNGTRWCSQFSYTNYGQTPAYNVNVYGVVRSSKNGMNLSKDLPDPLPLCKGDTPRGALSKDGIATCEMQPMRGDENAIFTIGIGNAPDIAYYLVGFIEYDDVYGTNTRIPFCQHYLTGQSPAPSGFYRVNCLESEGWNPQHLLSKKKR